MKSGKSYKRNLLLVATLISLSTTMPMAVAVDYTEYHSSTTTYNDFATTNVDNRKYILDDNIDLGNDAYTLWGKNLLIEGNNKTIFQSFDEGGDWAFTSQTTPAKSIIIQNLGSFTLVSTDPETHKKVYTVNNTGYASNLPNGKSYGSFFLANSSTPSAITLTIDNVVISDYTEQYSSKGLITLNAASTIQNSLFKDNTQSSLISLLSENTIRNTDSVNILNTAFVNNTITGNNYTALINSPSYRGNTSSNAENKLYIKDSYFEGNKGTNGGGLIYWNTQNGVEVDNSVFINNGTSYAGVSSSMAIGGAIDATNLSLKDSYFEGNYHKNTWNSSGSIPSYAPVQAGGAISSTLYKNTTSSTVSIDNTDFKDNYVETTKLDALGGALYLKDAITTITNGSDFTGNYATSTNGNAYGGAIYQEGGTLTISGSTFGGTGEGQGNSANSTNGYAYGGAIYNKSESGTISADFISNSANGYKSYGGAIYNEGAITSINNSTFANNSVTSENSNVDGGAIYNGSLHTIGNIGADFTNNSATGEDASGGAIYNYSSSTGTTSIGAITKITNGFKGNSATATDGNAYGGAIYNLSAYQPSGVFTPSFVSIGNLNTDFTQNHVEATGDALGGAIYNAMNLGSVYTSYNKVSIGNINGNFTGNYAKSTGGSSNAQGGAIFITNANVGNITGDFEGNYAETYKGQAGGGAIIINNTSSNTVGTISGNFTGNYAKSTVSSNIENSNGAYAGAIFNNTSDLTIENSTFTGNYVESKRNSGDQNSHGGAIYNKGNINISNTTFDGNYAKGNGGAFAYGGAIYNNFSNDASKVATITGSTFTNNSTINIWGNADGGAIYQNRGTLNLIDTSFTGNKGTDGAAISAWNANVTVYAKNSNVEFTKNNITGLADGDGYGIGIYGGTSLNLKADTGKTLTINDNIFSGDGITINADGNGGTVTLNGALQESDTGKITLNSGILALGQNALNSFATSSNNLNFVANGGTLDIKNSNIDDATFAKAVDIKSAMNLGLDINLNGTTVEADKITADITSGNTSPITISAINFIHDNYTGSEEEHALTVADGTIKSLINETVNPAVTGNTNTYLYSYNKETGILTLTVQTYSNIHDAVADSSRLTRTYQIKVGNGETVEHAIGAIAGATSKLTINGNNKYLDGKVGGVNQGGFIVADGQTLTLKNISSLKNFTTAVDNAGTLNVENVTFTGNTTADINNTATLNLSGNNTIKTITDAATPTGTTNITGGLTTIANSGSVVQNAINLKGGHLNLDAATVNANIFADGTGESSGSLRIGDGVTLNGTISGTFKNNPVNNPAIYFRNLSNADIDDLSLNSVNFDSNKDGAIRFISNGDLTLTNNQFTNNERSVNSIIGNDASGAVTFLSSGTNSITGSTFTGNKTKADTALGGNAYGGAIYQQGGTLTISGSTFGGSEEGQGNSVTSTTGNAYGGAIYQENGTYSITGTKSGTGDNVTSTTMFINNVADGNDGSEGGAVYIKNTSGTIDGVVFKSNEAVNGQGGGAIALESGGTHSIKNTAFLNNVADVGAAIYNNETTSLTIENSVFTGNNSSYKEGAIFSNASNQILTIKDSIFTDNDGGAIYANSGGTITVQDTSITATANHNSGSAIYLNQQFYKDMSASIIAKTANVEISGYKDYGIAAYKDFVAPNLTLYAQGGNILIKNNTQGGINNVGGILTMNADSGHNITINDAISSTTGMTINAGGTHAGTVALNGALTLGDVISVGGGTLELGSTAVTSLANAIETNDGMVKLTGGTLTQNIAGATTITGTVTDNNATLGNITITNTGNFTDNGGTFTTADNAGTFNVNGVTLTATGTSINNTATLNLSGENYIKTITGSTGNTYITGGTTTISQNGSATQKVINISDGELIADYGTTITATEGVKLQGGTLKAQNGATVNNIIADEHYTGNRLVVLGGGFSSLEGTFKGSNTYRALDYNSATALTIDGVTFDSNAAGAIYHSWSGTVDSSISNSTFTNNSNEYDGGAYYQFSTNGSDHTVSFNNVTFTSNSATNKGGAILAGLNAVNKLNISNSTFTSNTVTSANGIGSAIYLQGIAGAENTPSSFTIDNSTFTSNGAGGVVYANGGNLTVKNSTFTSNSGDAIVLADNYQYWTIIGGQITAVYSPITANIVAETGNVSITGNSGWGIVGNNNHETESALTLYAKSGNITINGNTAGGINNNGLVLTLNADTDHNITINDTVSSTTGMTVNAGGTHAGTVALNDALTLGDVISVGGGTLELGSTAVTSLNKAISTNSGTVKLTGGTLTQAIAGNTTVSGSDVTLGTNGSLVNVTVANGAKLTSQASQFTTMNNLGTLLLSGTLDKAISGTGETKINQTLTFAEGENPAKASIAGTLNMNSGTLNMVEEETPAYTNYTVGTLKGSGNLAIDFDGTNTDKLTITTADETPITVTLTALNGFTKGQDAVSAKTILEGASNITLAISDTLRTAYNETTHEDVYHTDTIVSNANWDTEFKNRYFDKETGKQLVVNNDTVNKTLEYKYTVEEHADETKDISLGDTLALVNQKEDTTRSFTTTDKTATYNVGSVLGETGAGKITVQGATDGTNTSTLNMAGNTGFVVGSGAEVELNTVKITNTANSDGSLINNTAGTATLNNVEIASNSVNVISSSGTLGVTNSTVNAGVNNDGTMNLNGTNQIASVEGSNGTAYVQTGTTTVGSIFQKLISIVSGGKLASNGDVTATNGITNDTTNGLSITNGKLTGNVTGEGSTKFSGTSSIANGSVVGQAITVVDGKLTTLADGLGEAVTNGGTVELTGGNLTKEISGVSGSTVINTASDVTIGTGGLISQTVAIQAGTLKTGVNGFTQNITSNAGVVELTGTGTLTQTIAGNTTISGTDITNNGSLANVTIADGGVLTSNANGISGTINNGGTLKLSGDLNKTISGSGETIANSDLTIGTNANVTGTLNANGKTLSMSGDSLATQTNIGTLKGNGKLSVDVVNNSGTIVSDSIKATNYDSIAYEITNISGLDSVISGLDLTTTTGDSSGFNLTVLDGYTGNGLTVATSITSGYTGAKNVNRSQTDELTQTASWTDHFGEQTWQDQYNQNWDFSDGKVAYTVTKTGETAHVYADGDTLQMLNTTTNFGTGERKFVTTDAGATYDVTADSLGATAAGTMTVKGATDGTNTSTINMANNTGFVVGDGATVNFDTVNITGTKTADGSLINNTAGEVNLNNVSVATNTNDVIANNSTMNLTGSNDINSGITGTGTTNVKSGTSIIDRITQKVVEIFGGSKLETETVTASEQVKNAGDLTITGASNSSKITGTGTTEFKNNVNNSGDISQGTVKVADGKTLTTTGDITTDNLTNGGTVTLNSADTTLTIKGGTAETPTTVAGTINGTGSTVIEGNAQNNGTIASAVEIATSGKLSTNASNVTGAVTNNAIDGLTLTGGTIQNAINGTGSTVIAGTVSNSGDKSIDNAVTIASGSLTTDASQIKQAVTNNVNDGLNLTGGNLASNITGTGSTVISGNVTNNNGKSLGTDMTVNGGASITTNADNIGGDITNSGNVQLTGGTLAKDITGGTTQIAGDVTNSANIGGTTNITSGSLDNSNGKITDATIGAGTSLTSNADNVSGTVNVTGDYNVTGGAIAGAVTGTGNTNINADTEVKAAVSSNINVADGKTLNVNPTSGNISSAVSVALGDGSKLDISGNTASGDTLNNISVASGKTANLAMDWGDSIGNTTNINGKLNISDVDLTGTTSTTTPTSYAIATGSNLGNVVLDESVNLKTNDTSFNQVKYNSTTGAFTGAKNNLVQAVTTTEAGESAIYSMSGDEPAGTLGAGVLDGGKLIVQGNGNTITGYGIEVGDGTHNAILTIKDANMKDITGDALLVKGGNTVTVMAENSDIEISGATGNAITLNKDTNGNSIVNIEGGSHTVTIENDIISDDSGNTVKFNSGTINFNGKFDPAAAVVGGATVNRGGDDDGINWTVTSGTLNYLQDSYLNRATNTMNLNGGTLNTVNGVVTDFALGGFTLSNDSNFYADVDLAAGKMDNFLSTPTTYTGGTLHVAGLNLISDATADNTSIPFANSTLAGHVDYTGAQGLTALSPIYKYNVGYNSSNGNFDFARYNSGGYDGLNPAIMAAPVAAQMGGYLTQLNSYDEAFRNMDMYMLMTAQQRQALKNKNKIASLDGGVLYDQTLMRQERAEGWFRPFATFEKVGLRNGPKVENIAYGTYMGGESQMYDLGHGWDGMWGAYVGYNGSHQNYDGVSIYQNGGTLGVLGMAYKGNFFTGLTINAGASGVEASTMYGNEDFAMLMAGIASKTGYNWELFNGKFIIQPSMLMSYSFVNTFDYKNAAGVNVDSDPLHAIQLQPEIKFIGNLKNGWQPYASVAMVWNIMDNTKFKANDVSLPELSVKPYVKYGVGVRKTWGERLTGFFQTYLTNGGRNGVGLQAGFTWAFGGGKNKKADEQKIQKSLNKTPELKKTEIVLNGKKVQ